VKTFRTQAARSIMLPDIAPGALRRGEFSDAYFLNAARILRAMVRSGAGFRGTALVWRGGRVAPRGYRPGEAEVEMQFFARRRPRFVAAGLPLALGMLRDAWRPDPGQGRVEGRRALSAWAVPEGTLTRPLEPVLRVRGPYRMFAHLETPILGVLTRASRVATNVFDALVASRGKPILFFPARFDLPQTQAVDGYAYRQALRAYARHRGRRVASSISTDAQGRLWGGRGGGTVPHAYILCFLGDTAESMLAFCRHLPISVPRVALVDTTNDCVGESVRTARRLFEEHLRLLRGGRRAKAARYVLQGVRADTAAELRDRSVPPAHDRRLERGVTPALIRLVRQTLDLQPAALGLPSRWRRVAERYFRSIRIVATGGFDAGKIRFFERQRTPVDMYGLGSHLLRGAACDFTADVVRVRVGGRYLPAAKVGRAARSNHRLRSVRLW
jgi:nicotinate phosphoribosyltransferase